MAVPAIYNLVCPQGTTFEFQFRPQTDGVNWDLSGYTAIMTVRPFAGSTTATLVATTENGKVVIDNTAHNITVTFSALDTLIKAESYVYDFMLFSGDIVTRLLEGKFVVTAGVTV